jgi:hypothetical protein
MQKVVGSNPISRFLRAPAKAGVLLVSGHGPFLRSGVEIGSSAFSCPNVLGHELVDGGAVVGLGGDHGRVYGERHLRIAVTSLGHDVGHIGAGGE